MQSTVIWLGLGANAPGPWGEPAAALGHALTALQEAGLRVVARSDLIESLPLGTQRQAAFTNAVIAVSVSLGPAALLRLAKRIERQAGRRPGRRWGPRPLDIDLLAFKGRIYNPHARHRLAGRLILPHPEIAHRGFVLLPLAQLSPGWLHPVLGKTARQLLARKPLLRRGIRRLGPFFTSPLLNPSLSPNRPGA